MSEINLPEVLRKYPCLGRINRVAVEHKYGFVGATDDARQDLLIHVRNHADKRLKSLEGLEGQYVAYVIGGNPIRYAEGKTSWDSQIVEWQLLQGYEYLADKLVSQRICGEVQIWCKTSQTNYTSERRRILDTLDEEQLNTLLAAKWYLDVWKQKTGELLKSNLQADAALKSVVDKRPATLHRLDKILAFVDLVSNSPWFSEQDKENIRKRHLQLDSYPPSIFSIARDQINQKELAKLTELYGEQLKQKIRMANAIAIDLESNGKEIFQFGWKNTKGKFKTVKIQGTNEPIDIKFDFKRCLDGTQAPIIIGHNLLAWDKRILEEHGVAFPEQSAYWDTLLASWILEPWKKTHALIVQENGHSADADAAACYKLFEEQTTKLDHQLDVFDHDLNKLVDKLFEDPTLLSTLPTREYPSSISSKQADGDTYLVCDAYEAAWQKDCHIGMSSVRRLEDPVLSPEICREVAEDCDTSLKLSAKMVSIVVSDASNQGVQVLLSNLPFWLVDKALHDELKEKHYKEKAPDDEIEHHQRITVRFADDWFCLKNAKHLLPSIQHGLTNKTELLISWQKAKAQTIRDIADKGYVYPGLYASEDGWILAEYSKHGKMIRESLPLPESVPDCLDQRPVSRLDAATSVWVCAPRWRDPLTNDMDVTGVFLWPDTDNRNRYLEDMLQQLLSIHQAVLQDEMFLFCMRCPYEAQRLQEILVGLSLSSPAHNVTSLRHLESVIKCKQSVIACNWDTLVDYLQASELFQKQVRIAIEELPLLRWHAALTPPSQTELHIEDESESDEEADSGSDNVVSGDASKKNERRAKLSPADKCAAVATFLKGWLQRRTRTDNSPSKPILLLDGRITDNSTAKSLQLAQVDVPYKALNELLSQEQIDSLRKYFLPARDLISIPNDYASYKDYLKKNWGFDDFRAGTQKQAIEKFIETPRDMLVRLPTGGGKSIIFHLPALFRTQYTHRLSIVITPLRALMDDQVKGLWAKGFSESVDFLSGGRDPWLNDDVYQGICDGRIKLLFVAPERFRLQKFTDVLEKRRHDNGGLEFIVFDEAHCISEWGFEFRPDYLYAARYIAEQFKKSGLAGNPTRLLLTSATITQRNRLDLEKELGLTSGDYEDLPHDMPHPIQSYIKLQSFDLQEEGDADTDHKFAKIIKIIEGFDLEQSAVLLFVRKRSDCHDLSDWLNEYAAEKGSKLSSLPFHAGLHESEKEEAVARLKDKKVNVLVCTKAFGMGMDIGHIHACIHYQPPTFIEDYLQEVGRIGRDEDQRLKTGNELVTATLLYNAHDQERNLGLLHDMAVNPPMLQDFLAYCQKGATPLLDNFLNFIPARVSLNDTKGLSPNQVVNCLFWLERMKVLRVEGKIPPFLELHLNRKLLSGIAKGKETLPGKLANTLLEIDGKSQDVISQLNSEPIDSPVSTSETALGRVVKGVLRGIFALLSPPKQTEEKIENIPPTHAAPPNNTDDTNEVTARFSMSALMSSCGGITQDKLFEGLVKLCNLDAVKIQKTLKVTPHTIPSSEDRFWDLCKEVINILTKPSDDKETKLSKKQLEERLLKKHQQPLEDEEKSETIEADSKGLVALQTRQLKREVKRAIATTLKMLRYAGLKTHDLTDEYACLVPQKVYPYKNNAQKTIEWMKKLLNVVNAHQPSDSSINNAPFEIELEEVLFEFKDVTFSKIKQLMKLLETAGFCLFENLFSDMVTLVMLENRLPLEAYHPDSTEDSPVQACYREMLEKHDMQVLRAQAMILLTIMPAEDRKQEQFIDKYFASKEKEDLKELLEKTVGDIAENETDLPDEFRELVNQVRQEHYAHKQDELTPEQKQVCVAHYSKNLLVNAGPGSGKTHVLIMRCAHLIHVQKIPPSEILVLAFNRAVVYEIRKRIREIFRQIGYGRYADKLDVTTFHAFALRHQGVKDRSDEDSIESAVHSFAENIKTNKDSAKLLAGKYKAILVDEFQDMNEDFFAVVKCLIENCNGGGMVIGDDDQDILMWNRRNWNKKNKSLGPLEAVAYFERFCDAFAPEEHYLIGNFRSGKSIIDQANMMIMESAKGIGFRRKKSNYRLEARSRNTNDEVCVGVVTKTFNPDKCVKIINDTLTAGNDCAILCRSNRECREVYNLLKPHVNTSDIIFRSSVDLLLNQLRDFGALLDICKKYNDYEFIDQFVWDQILNEFKALKLPNDKTTACIYINLYDLLKQEVGRPRFRDLLTFIGEMRTSDLERLQGHEGKLTISTISKVKGLEYHTVIVWPSQESFPFVDDLEDNYCRVISDDAIEEARLFYVGITRARDQLFWMKDENIRMKHWLKSIRFKAQDEKKGGFLKGSPEEVVLTWPGRPHQIADQEYIKNSVLAGEELIIKFPEIFHKQCKIATLSTKARNTLKKHGMTSPPLRVSNVLRYPCGTHMKEKNSDLYGKLDPSIKEQGWCYTVLVEEC